MTWGNCSRKNPLTMRILSNEETIENGETGEDDKAATTEVSEFEN